MKAVAVAVAVADSAGDKKGHICPPSNASHPRDRWESLFVYSFICKFTNMRGKVDGLNTPMDFEEALLSREPNPVITQILSRFVLNLKPQTRHTSTDHISTTVATVLAEYFKSSERTVFWSEEQKANVDPFPEMQTGFFAAEWDMKLKILRQLVELQLTHCTDIKTIIDRAWGVTHNKEKRKGVSNASGVPDPTDSGSQERLATIPLGQDSSRKRYWVADDSPRVYISTNPWKMTASFQTVSSSRDEYAALINKLKASAPSETKAGEKRSKLEHAHIALVKALEERVEKIDAEIAKIARARKKMEQKQILLAQAEIRQTRTRRQARRPDYVYNQDGESDDEGDAYAYQEPDEDEEYEDRMEEDGPHPRNGANGRRAATRGAGMELRRSSRAVTQNNGHRQPSEEWKGERRSSRLGAPPETQLDGPPPPKRARTEESMVSDGPSVKSEGSRVSRSVNAALLKPTETAMEQVAGKKKSRYWFYAVEPVSGAAPVPPSSHASSTTTDGPPAETSNGDHAMEDSASPAPSVEAEDA